MHMDFGKILMVAIAYRLVILTRFTYLLFPTVAYKITTVGKNGKQYIKNGKIY